MKKINDFIPFQLEDDNEEETTVIENPFYIGSDYIGLDPLTILLKKVLIDKNFDLKKDKDLYKNYELIKIKKKSIVIQENDPLEYLYLNVSGTANVIHITSVGELIIFDHVSKPHIFGLIEFLDNCDKYYKSVNFVKGTKLIKIPKKVFEEVPETLELLKIYNRFLLDFSINSIVSSDLTANYGKKRNLIEFFISKCTSENFPIKINLTKKVISDYLRINERTMYRYLNEFIDNDYITRENRKLFITEENYKRLVELSDSKDLDDDN